MQNASTKLFSFTWYMRIRIGHEEQHRFIFDAVGVGTWLTMLTNIQQDETLHFIMIVGHAKGLLTEHWFRLIF